MADIQALALRAAEKLANRDASTEVDAISKAIRGAGITNKADHKRLMSEVGTQFVRNKRDEMRGGARGRSSSYQS